MSKSDFEKALDRAQFLCSRQEKCITDIKTKLNQWGVDPLDAVKIIESLVKHDFINESRYATSFARDKARFNKWGPKKIEMALKAKRVSSENISLAMDEASKHCSEDALSAMLEQKLKTLKYKDKFDLKNKLLRFSISRGYSYHETLDTIEQIITRIEE